jgi:hypothetical protein
MKQIAVVDRKTHSITRWPLTFESNYGANQDGDVRAEKDDLCIDWAGHVSLSG